MLWYPDWAPTVPAGDKRWMLVVEGQGGDYRGPAVEPRHLSLFENLVGLGRAHGANATQTNGLHQPRGGDDAAR